MPTFSASLTALFLLGVPAAMAAQAQSGGKISHDRSTARTERFTDRWLYSECARILANPEDHWPADVKRCREIQH